MLLRWTPPRSAGPVAFRVLRVVADPSAPGGRFERSLGTTGSTELSDAGVPRGVTVWHEVMSTAGGRRSKPVRTPPLVIVPEVTSLRAHMDGDGVALSWRLDAGYDDVLIERTFDESSPFRGAARRFRATGGQHVDRGVQTGATYRYRVRVSYPDPFGALAHTSGVEVVVTVVRRPRPVLDLEVNDSGGTTVLRWTTVPGALVRIYATEAPPDPVAVAGAETGVSAPEAPGGDPAGHEHGPRPAAEPEPFGPVDHELSTASLRGRERLVGSSRRGRLVDTAAPDRTADPAADPTAGPTVYTPVSIAEDRAVVGRSIRHRPGPHIRALRAVDQGNTITLTFQMPPGITEARVLWRHDTTPTGPDDPAARRAKITNSSLEIRGGWHLRDPQDGATYYFAVFPLVRTAGEVRAVPNGAHVTARAGARPTPSE